MKKLIRGILEFRRKVRPDYAETFAKLALGQKPGTLFVACSDSRVVPNLFASTDPGDLFVVRNVGNLIAPFAHSASTAEAAAIEFALHELPVTDIIVCGHSECGAMNALLKGGKDAVPSGITSWLAHGEASLKSLESGSDALKDDTHLERHNRLSQLNVLQQLQHLQTYPLVDQRMREGKLKLHGWWFDIRHADVYEYVEDQKRFRLIGAE